MDIDYTKISIIVMVITYILLTGIISIRIRSKTNTEFMTASKSMSPWVIGCLLMAAFTGAPSTIGTAQSAYQYGFASIWAILAISIGFLIFGLFFVKRIYASGEFTISGFIAKKYGKSTKLIISLLMIIAMFIANVGNYISGAASVAIILDIDFALAMVIIGIVSTFYFMIGGLKGVAIITIVHAIMKFISIAIILVVALFLSGGILPVINELPEYYFSFSGDIGINNIIAWIIVTTGSIFSTQFVIQSICANKNTKSAQKSCFIAALLCIPLGIGISLSGVIAKYLFPNIQSIYALPIFLQYMSPMLSGLAIIGILATVFISVATVALSISSLLIQDFYISIFKLDKQNFMKIVRRCSLLIGIVPMIFAFTIPEVLKLSFFSRALRLSITVIAIISVSLPLFNSTKGINIAIVLSTLLTAIWYILDDPWGINNIYIALLTPTIVILGENFILKKLE